MTTLSPAVTPDRTALLAAARRVVVKLGTAVLTHGDGTLALARIYGFIESIAALRRDGRDVLVVTSGAVGLGAARLGLLDATRTLAERQACAAVGQGRLMAVYADAFDRLGVTVAQVLLTRDDFQSRQRSRNLARTLNTLLEMGVVPIINENDTVATDELETGGRDAPAAAAFGDNDGLSALLAAETGAGLLLILTDVEGVYTADPRGAAPVRLIPYVDPARPAVVRPAGAGRRGRGGMQSKVRAAGLAARHGCACIVASGHVPAVIDRVFAAEALGTLFPPAAVGPALPGSGEVPAGA